MVNFMGFLGVSVSNLSDNFLILHVTCDDSKQKVGPFMYFCFCMSEKKEQKYLKIH